MQVLMQHSGYGWWEEEDPRSGQGGGHANGVLPLLFSLQCEPVPSGTIAKFALAKAA